ncbi:hypothetical protein UFOVP252_44 [uncultured Caudovirales phage]|uniref:Uncharacterized protein n=1 Tax=uncultured Caudovirales phage TaxID=2100421 RepID=A0A6J5LJ83_9CAUD|nr:hypothetical protein UFOVP252_44 [uncultured Caudovirales phage]
MTDEELHMKAARYATNRREAYARAMNGGKVERRTPKQLNWDWIAHYEGYREGYWVATGDTRFSTDPGSIAESKLKEKNTP